MRTQLEIILLELWQAEKPAIRIDQCPHPSGNVRAARQNDGRVRRPGGQLHDERNEVQQRGDGAVQELGENPVDGQIEHLTDAEQIDEHPQQRRNERGDDDEEEPVRGTEMGG